MMLLHFYTSCSTMQTAERVQMPVVNVNKKLFFTSDYEVVLPFTNWTTFHSQQHLYMANSVFMTFIIDLKSLSSS